MNQSTTSGVRPMIQAPVVSPGRPWIRTTFQLSSMIPGGGADVDEKYAAAIKSAIYWVKDKVPGGMPQAAWAGESFRLEWPGQKVEAISIPDLGIWSFRLEHPDMPFGDQPACAGRSWTTDIAFKRGPDHIDVGIRVFCASLPYADADVAMTRPGVVNALAKRLGLTDQRSLSHEPWSLGTEQDLCEFGQFLRNPERQLPVVVLTQPDKKRLGITVSEYVLDPAELSRRTLGVAHVVKLPWELSYKWTKMVGKPWSVYLGAVRTYMPGLDFDNDSPPRHPSTFAENIVFWKLAGDDRVGEGPFTDFLVERLFQHAAMRRLDWGSLLFLPEARTKHAEIARQKASEGDDWQELYEEHIKALEAKVAELEKEAEEYSDDAIRSAQERDVYKEDNRQLRYQVDLLRQALSERTGGKSESEIPIPDNYEDMPDWVTQHLTGRVVLHSRALRGIKDAVYEDVARVYKGLLLLGNEYRNRCLGREGSKEAFEEKLGEVGLRFDQSISKIRAGEQGDEYYVRYPTASSPKRFLEWHLRKGSTKDDRLCLGVYFFWDNDTQQVVVGWLPSHLDLRMS